MQETKTGIQSDNLKENCATEFLDMLYGNVADGWLTIWHKKTKRTRWFHIKDKDKAVKYSLSQVHSKANLDEIYYGVCPRKERRNENSRGDVTDISVVPGLWWDIDVAEENNVHAQNSLPHSFDEALRFMDEVALKPSVIVHSGHGLHAYWLFDTPIYIDDESTLRRCIELSEGFQRYLNGEALKRGWKCDNTSDLPRILRLPGTVNRKNGGNVEVRVIENSGSRYSIDELSKLTTAPAAMKEQRYDDKKYQTIDFVETIPTDAGKMMANCAFMKHCKANASMLTEPEWYACISNLALCKDGDKLCHEISRPYSNYNKKETTDKIAHAQKARKPVTCEYIRSTLGFNCEDCKSNCKAPIALTVMSKAKQAKEVLARDITDYATVFTNEYIDALSYAKNNLAAEYGAFKLRIKGKVSILDLDRAIKQHIQKYENDKATKGVSLKLDGLDLDGIVMPNNWDVSIDGGVRKKVSTNRGKTEIVACPDAVVITKRFVNADDGKERLVVSFDNDGRWKSIIAPRAKFYQKNAIVEFCDDGLLVSSGTAGELVSYLSDFETVNKHVIPKRLSVSRLGWLNDTEFFPYATESDITFEEDTGAQIYRNLSPKGDYTAWKETLLKVRENPFARFILSASFASPLLEKIGMRTFVIHLWHNSASGKSAALKAAISVWGNPLRIMGNGFTTVVGTEQLAGTLKHLPFGIDEKQSADEKKMSLEHLVYILGQGSGKIRGKKGSGNAELASWRNIVMLTGEEPVTKHSSLDGIQTRTLEIYGKPVESVRFAKEVHTFCENNYGYAGAEFMRVICSRLKAEPNFLKVEYDRISAKYKAEGIESVHADYIAAVTLGDILSSSIVFGIDREKAEQKAYECGKEIYYNNLSQMSGDSSERAYDFVKGWLLEHDGRFASHSTPCYGKKQDSRGGRYTEYYVFTHRLHEALEDAGFNTAKALQGFVEKGYLAIERDAVGRSRNTKVAWINGASVRCYIFKLPKNLPPEQMKMNGNTGDLIPLESDELPY